MGRPKGSKNKRKRVVTEAHKQRLEEGRKAAKEHYVDFSIGDVRIRSDRYNWICEWAGSTYYFSRLDYMCLYLLEHKIKRKKVGDMQELLEEVRKTRREIMAMVPHFLKQEGEE